MSKNLLLLSSNSNTWFPLPALENNWYWLFQMGRFPQDMIPDRYGGLVGGDSEFVSSIKSDLVDDVYETSFKGFSFKPSTKSELEITIRGACLGNAADGFHYIYLYVKTLEEAEFLTSETYYTQYWYYYPNKLTKGETFDVLSYFDEVGGGFVVYLDLNIDLYGFEPSVKFAWCLNVYD